MKKSFTFYHRQSQRKYPGKKIFGITEITSANGIAYAIVLEDDKNWITITSNASGIMSLAQKLKKA